MMYRSSNNPSIKRNEPSKAKATKGPTSRNSIATPVSTTKEKRNIKSAAPNVQRPNVNSPTKQPRQSYGGQSSTTSETIENIVYDYLMKRNMHKTLEMFKDEAGKSATPEGEYDLNLETTLLDAFDKGNREAFFSKWNKQIPQHIRQKDEFGQKIEFYLHIYFVAYSIHPINKKVTQGINKEEVTNFKDYLDSRGRDLAQTTEFLPYYALPYVPNPLDHPSFKHIFTKEWVVNLRSKLEFFLAEMRPSEQTPLIYQIYSAYVNSANGREPVSPQKRETNETQHRNEEEYAKAIAQLEASNQELMNIVQEYNEKYGNLMREHQALQKNEEIARNHLFDSHTKWMVYLKELLVATNDLINAINAQKKGVSISDKAFEAIRIKVAKYESFINSNLEDFFSQSQDISTFEKTSISQDNGTPDHSISNVNYRPRNEERSQINQQSSYEDRSQINQQSYVALNYEKVKSSLLSQNGNESTQSALLQALRWRITRTQGAGMRREVIVSYSKHDLLDIRRKTPCVLEAIFSNRGKKICEYGARLINSLTSDYYGRTYLLESDKLVNLLINIFITETGDTVVRRNCLGALQKLSLRKKPQLVMIQKDIIKWIIDALKNERNSLGEYFYEYATALLMNLSLRSLGKKKCEDPKLGVLEMLNDLLEHENMQVRSFVNGTLYSLLSNPVFRENAKAMGMGDILAFLMENVDERYRKQIHYILQRLNSDHVDEETHSDTEEDNDYDDMEEEDEMGEDDDMEDQIDDPQTTTGEDLLRRFFSLSGPEAQRQNSMIQEAMEESKSFIKTFKDSTISHPRTSNMGTPLNRPTTPIKLNRLMQQSTVEGENDSEVFRHKPRVLRTPHNVKQDDFHRILQSQQEVDTTDRRDEYSSSRAPVRQSFNEKKEYDERVSQDRQSIRQNKTPPIAEEQPHPKAFKSVPKIPRTPPDEKMTKPGQHY